MNKNKYVFKLNEGRDEPIPGYKAIRKILIDSESVGAENITFAYARFDGKTSYHKKHSHKNAEEVMYILSGKGMQGAEDKEFVVEEGDTIWVPKGVVHWGYNPFDEPLEMIFAYTAPSLKEVGYELHELVE